MKDLIEMLDRAHKLDEEIAKNSTEWQLAHSRYGREKISVETPFGPLTMADFKQVVTDGYISPEDDPEKYNEIANKFLSGNNSVMCIRMSGGSGFRFSVLINRNFEVVTYLDEGDLYVDTSNLQNVMKAIEKGRYKVL